MPTERQGRLRLESYIQSHEVFRLEDLTKALGEPGRRSSVRNSLSYHLRGGRVKSLSRGVYATVPPGADPERFQPDRYLVAAAVRPDAVFSHHAALELLGAAHSDWNVCAVSARARHPMIRLAGVQIRFFLPPAALVRRNASSIGTRQVPHRQAVLKVTTAERTLIDGFRRPELTGGPAELVESAAGFGVLDLDLLFRLLTLYDEKLAWAAVGWFLERFQSKFFVPDASLARLERQRPKSPQYLMRSQRGGVLGRRWNLILPESLEKSREPDER